MITLEIAKQLKEAGWSKKTKNYYWSKNNYCYRHDRGEGCVLCDDTGLLFIEWIKTDKFLSDDYTTKYIKAYPCPTLEELLEEMPYKINYEGGDGNTDAFMSLGKHRNNLYSVEYTQPNGIIEYYTKIYSDPAEAVALLWLKLKQEGLV